MSRVTSLVVAAATTATLLSSVNGINDGLLRTPLMGTNSWTSFGGGVTGQDLITTGQLLTSLGLAAVGFNHVNCDDGWANRAANNSLYPDPNKFPNGIYGVVGTLAEMNISFGIYSAASSVVCSGRPGTLFQEYNDAATFASWGVSLVKYDNCGEYSYGNTRFITFADAVAASGKKMIISTEPFSLVPNPDHSQFAHYYRTGNDIDANWGTILDRIDRNDKWSSFAGPGHFGDPDMLQVGNGGLSDAQNRAHFGLWAITKSPLILGADLTKFTPNQTAIVGNPDIIAINQDPLGVQARKLAINGTLTQKFVGVMPCSEAMSSPRADGLPGFNGVTPQSLSWTPISLGASYLYNNTLQMYALFHNASGRCLGTRYYVDHVAPMLLPCAVNTANVSSDLTQAWIFPTGTLRIGGILNVAALQANSPNNALGVGNSTIYGTVHGNDDMPLPDISYGINYMSLFPYNPEPTCTNRNCQDYDPTQSWYWTPRFPYTLNLAMNSANMYRCFEGPCYQLTSHMPTAAQWCLSQVASISNDGLDPTTTSTGGQDVWGGPLSGGNYVFAALNRDSPTNAPTAVTVKFSMLEDPAMGDATVACVRELYTNTLIGTAITGSFSVTVAPYDLAVMKVFPGQSSC